MNSTISFPLKSKFSKHCKSLLLMLLPIILSNTTFAQVANPYVGSKTAFMHNDAFSSDVFSELAPSGNLSINFETKKGAVPTILQGKDGFLQVICVRNESETENIDPTPFLLLIDPKTMSTFTSLKLQSGTALNNIYGYLNENDELMLANGKTIFKIAHIQTGNQWNFEIKEKFILDPADNDFQFVAITPDWEGNIWFASYDSQAGFLNPKTGTFKILKLSDRKDEIVANSISSCPDGIAIATTHSLYAMNLIKTEPNILWKADYDRGDRVKPGNLSWGTGSSPSFFGPTNGYEYLTILDNGTNGTRLNIYDTKTGNLIASELAFEGDINQGSENSPIAYNNSVIIASTYGFTYPASSSATDELGELKNGMQRFDVLPNGSGAKSVWYNKDVRTTSVPKLGKDSKKIYFINEDSIGKQFYAAIDFETGNLVTNTKIDLDPYSVLPNTKKMTIKQRKAMLSKIGNPFNALQMAGLFDGNGNLYQGTKFGILKISSSGN